MTKTFCPHCYGMGGETFIETEYDEVVWEEFHTCHVCNGTGEVEVVDKSGPSCDTSCNKDKGTYDGYANVCRKVANEYNAKYRSSQGRKLLHVD